MSFLLAGKKVLRALFALNMAIWTKTTGLLMVLQGFRCSSVVATKSLVLACYFEI